MKLYIWLFLSMLSLVAHADQTACVNTSSNGVQRNCITLKTVATSASAADLSAGTLPAARLPSPTASTIGGVQSKAAVTGQFLVSIGTDGTIGQAAIASSNLPRLVCGGSAPTIAAGSAAGTGPTVSVTAGSGDNCGRINLTTGTSPTTAGPLATVTFASAFGNTPFCVLTPANGISASISNAAQVWVSTSNSTYVINAAIVSALSASTAYSWNYWCGANS